MIGRTINFSASKEEGFKTTISRFKQVNFPLIKIEEYQISDRDIVNIRVETSDGKIVDEPIIVKQLIRKDRSDEYIGVFRLNDINAGLADARIEGKLEKLNVDPAKSTDDIIYVPNLFPAGHIGKLDRKSVV